MSEKQLVVYNVVLCRFVCVPVQFDTIKIYEKITDMIFSLPSLLFYSWFCIVVVVGGGGGGSEYCWCCYYWPVIARDFSLRLLIRVGIHMLWQKHCRHIDLALKAWARQGRKVGRRRRKKRLSYIAIAADTYKTDDRSSVTGSLYCKCCTRNGRQSVLHMLVVCVYDANRWQYAWHWHRRWILIGFSVNCKFLW